MLALQAKFNQAMALHQQGKLAEAEHIYGEVLRQQPIHFDALHLLGIIAAQTRRTERAVELIRRAIGLNAKVAAAHSNLGNALRDLKRPADALASHDKAIALKPNYAEAYYNRGNALLDLSRPADALASYDKAITLKPNNAEAFYNRGNALLDLNRPSDALASYDKAIALKPDHAKAHNNRGKALLDLKRLADALASYDEAIALKPDYTEAHNNRGNVLIDLKRPDEALASCDKAITLRPDFAEAHQNRGNALLDLKRPTDALASYDKAIALKPDYAEAYYNCGNALLELNRLADALVSYDKVIALKPDLAEVEGLRLHTKLHLCDWGNFDAESEHLISAVRNGKGNAQPFPFLAFPSTSADQLRCAKLNIANRYPPEKPIWRDERYNHDRIRVAYISADFRQHPVSVAIAGMFERHDNSHFDVSAISLGPDDNSELRQRLKASSEHFIDARTYSDNQIANLVREQEIDILVDLMGFTKDARPSIFAKRPAPIQINYLGYPGTMGAEYIDYIIADRFVVPEEQYGSYSEQIVLLPNSYHVNDAKRSSTYRTFTRTELGLPSAGSVFCCFNKNYKITPGIFDCWTRILKQVDGSVLWLLEDNATASANLRKEAEARGVNADRLIFAKRMSLPDHLARHLIADLFLDTLPYNAHTTANDALWAGLPVLTCIGETFASRVAASLLNAICLPELITTTLEDYERLAIDLATHPEKLAAIKRKLAKNRLTTPLFDTKLTTKHIEAAYTAMYERRKAGLPPYHFVIPNS
jgi:predicted O-linked N-acetylglucosamine transferase (SPINDLY family)